MKYRYRPFCRIFFHTRNSQKSAITFLLCAYQMAFQRGAYPGRYACTNRTTHAYSWLDSRQNFNFASFPPRYSRTSTYDNCAHDSVYVRKPVLMDYKLLPYSPIQANVSLRTVFPRIVSAETILFWKLKCRKYSREESIQGRKLLFFLLFGRGNLNTGRS